MIRRERECGGPRIDRLESCEAGYTAARGRLHRRLGLFGRNGLGDILRNLALQCENVSELSIVRFAPVWDSGGGIDELHIDAHLIAGLRNTAQQ